MNNGPGSNGDVPRRVIDHRRRGGRRAHPQNRAPSGADGGPGAPALPKEDFDFDRANSKFDKSSIYAIAGGVSPSSPATPVAPEQTTSPEPGEIVENPVSPSAEEPRKFYDRSKSFFDDISSDTKAKTDGTAGGGGGGGRGGPGGSGPGGGRGRGGRGGGRNRRDEERTKNLSTFGEAGTNSGHGYGQWQGGNGGGPNGVPNSNGGGGSGWRGGPTGGNNNGNRRRRPSGQVSVLSAMCLRGLSLRIKMLTPPVLFYSLLAAETASSAGGRYRLKGAEDAVIL